MERFQAIDRHCVCCGSVPQQMAAMGAEADRLLRREVVHG